MSAKPTSATISDLIATSKYRQIVTGYVSAAKHPGMVEQNPALGPGESMQSASRVQLSCY
jgi:hypothetical protein